MSKQAQLDVLEQRQRDISRAIRDANELKAKVKAGTVDPTRALRLQLDIAKANQGSQTVTREPVFDVYGEPVLGADGKPLEKIVTRKVEKDKIGLPKADISALREGTTEANEAALLDAEAQRTQLDAYINELEAQQTKTAADFEKFIKTGVAPQDLLSRTRDAFQSQIGEGGFGISRRPLRQLPRFDELEAVGLLQDTLAKEESVLLEEAKRRTGAPLTLQQEQDVRKLARDRLREQMTQAGAEPTSRAGFLMKPPPPYEGLLPREETRVPTGRLRDDFGVEGGPAPLTREQEVIRDIGQGRTNYEKGFKTELEAVRQTDAATRRAPETPLEYSIRRNLELEAMGEPPVYDVNSPPTIEDAVVRARQEEIDTARLARDRGFDTPVENISGFRQGVMGIPGGLADRRVVNRLLRGSETSGDVTGSVPMESTSPSVPLPQDELRFGGGVVPGPATPEEEAIDSVLPEFSRRRGGTPKVTVGARGELPPMSEDKLPEGERIPLGGGVMYDAYDRVIYGKDGFPIFRDSQEANPNSAAPYQPQVVTPKELDKKVKEIKDAGGYQPEAQGAALSIPARRDLYAMKTIKRGLELADKPKQFARVAKTANPSSAPEYVRLVNGVYETNSSRPDRFKASYDEIARVYKDNPKNRELALSYLVAKDAVESNVTKPMA